MPPKKTAAVRSFQEVAQDVHGVFIGCLGDDEGFTFNSRVKNYAAARRRMQPAQEGPKPGGCCLGEYIESAFTRLDLATRRDPEIPSVDPNEHARVAPVLGKSTITMESWEQGRPH